LTPLCTRSSDGARLSRSVSSRFLRVLEFWLNAPLLRCFPRRYAGRCLQGLPHTCWRSCRPQHLVNPQSTLPPRSNHDTGRSFMTNRPTGRIPNNLFLSDGLRRTGKSTLRCAIPPLLLVLAAVYARSDIVYLFAHIKSLPEYFWTG
jgi:hypothetical protein